jgi:hypothetical protein
MKMSINNNIHAAIVIFLIPIDLFQHWLSWLASYGIKMEKGK